ncbi:hypothetical protein DAI22_07g186850 [Oryza sativa Japonica Group]|nr:hypothetical protein DAI22_07g186850 [Oryza sativa Japonica Group]
MIKPKLICGPLLPTPMPIFSSVSGSLVCPSARRRRRIAPPSRTLSRPGFPNSVRALSLPIRGAAAQMGGSSWALAEKTQGFVPLLAAPLRMHQARRNNNLFRAVAIRVVVCARTQCPSVNLAMNSLVALRGGLVAYWIEISYIPFQSTNDEDDAKPMRTPVRRVSGHLWSSGNAPQRSRQFVMR